MNEDVIDTFENITTVVNQEFIFQSCLFRLRHFAEQCLRSLHSKKRENEQLPAKKRSFLTV